MEKVENTTLDKILKEAKIEFMDKGYLKASLREIVRKAGVTTGAFYGYYKNKEQLFDALVGRQYNEILEKYQETLDNFFERSPEEQCKDMLSITYESVLELKDYVYDHYDAVKMILCCSEGTRYKDLIEKMAGLDATATRDFAKTMDYVTGDERPVHPILQNTLTSGMFIGFFELIVQDVPREEADEYISELLEFYSAGWGRLMGF